MNVTLALATTNAKTSPVQYVGKASPKGDLDVIIHLVVSRSFYQEVGEILFS